MTEQSQRDDEQMTAARGRCQRGLQHQEGVAFVLQRCDGGAAGDGVGNALIDPLALQVVESHRLVANLYLHARFFQIVDQLKVRVVHAVRFVELLVV